MRGGISSSVSYFEMLARTLRGIPSKMVDQIAYALFNAYRNDRTIFVFGNGGSATTASHFACDLGKGTIKFLPKDGRRFRVIALTDNVPLMTAWANDSDYEEIFSQQLRNLLRPGDVCVAISGSGNSANVLSALSVAQWHGATTIGLTGFNGGLMKSLCTYCLVVPSDNMEIIEDLHLSVCHSLSTSLRSALAQIAPQETTLLPRPTGLAASNICSISGTKMTQPIEAKSSEVELGRLPIVLGKATVRPFTQERADAD